MRKILLTAVIACLSTAAYAQQPRMMPAVCGPVETLREKLSAKYQEVEIAGGIVDEHTVTTVYASPGGETWTVVIMTADGQACIVAAGQDWFQSKPEPKGDPA